MNTQVTVSPADEKAATQAVKSFAKHEEKGNEHIRLVAASIVVYHTVYGRKSGIERFRELCLLNGVRRVMDNSTQRRFIAFAFLSSKNIGIESIAEGRWQKISDRIVQVDKYGKASFRLLLDEKTGEPVTVKDSEGREVATGETCEARFMGITDFKTMEGDKLDATFPNSGVKQKNKRAAIEASQGGIAPLTSNLMTALAGKPVADVKKALKRHFQDAPLALLHVMLDELKEIADDKVKQTEKEVTNASSLPSPTEKETSVTTAIVA